ncbi:LysR family transcriptional regulator [Salinisphaera sp. Q1T1-3]|uniref:LysR family transcriptional regulator n=1 Tax=Salinisphaera sp. Q1T1-3 TaxID=2321229 RepID=UPI000E73064E|nr:LysR family transcriptional regulator [Salinisphaera sp. Q1T1-3]RJS93232.1 LysR family transcriptional regulator [Salinisphaera sp. Q1T1-3]
MDRLDVMRLFVRIAERRSFTAAASDLGLSRSAASEAIAALEARLDVRLLQRTTRHVAPTEEGKVYHARCSDILAAIEDAEDTVSDTEPRGRLTVDLHGTMARHFLLPHLPAFMQRYPGLSLHIGEGDRLVDLVREGVDCVVRAGTPQDSDMIVRRVAALPEAVAASPSYLRQYGHPESPADLGGHVLIGFVSSATGDVMPLGLRDRGRRIQTTPASRITVAQADTAAELARLGFGLIQAPRYRLAEDFASGRLIELLVDYAPNPTPISVLYPERRQLSPRVRVFVDWVQDCFAHADGDPNIRGR